MNSVLAVWSSQAPVRVDAGMGEPLRKRPAEIQAPMFGSHLQRTIVQPAGSPTTRPIRGGQVERLFAAEHFDRQQSGSCMTTSSFDNGSAATDQIDVSADPRDRYTRVAIVLHWAIAAFIIFNLCLGFLMEGWRPPLRMTAMMLHASSGLTVLALTVARVVWRLLNDPPPYPPGMKRWERHAAHVAHFLLYAAMVLMPLSGWAILSAHSPPGSRGAAVEFGGGPNLPPGVKPPAPPPGMPPGLKGPPPVLKIWNLVPMPMIAPIEAIGTEPGGVAPQRKLHDDFVEWHSLGGYLVIGLLLLHVAGALKHQFIDRQSQFSRMWIGGGRRS